MLADIEDKSLRIGGHRYLEHSIMVDIASRFQDWAVSYARELKRKSVVQRSSRLCMTLSQGDMRYAVYLFTNIPIAATLHAFLTELGDLRAHKIRSVLVFCTSLEIMQAFADIKITSASECCLLLYPDGIAFIQRYLSEEFREKIQNLFPGAVKSNRPFAHYEYKGAYITCLTNCDLVIRSALLNYIKFDQKNERRRCIVICAPGQECGIANVDLVYDRTLKYWNEAKLTDRSSQDSQYQ